jgi:hypothetical protein
MPTGLQAALLALVRVLEAFRDEQLTRREYLTLLNVLSRRLERELDEQARASEWVA